MELHARQLVYDATEQKSNVLLILNVQIKVDQHQMMLLVGVLEVRHVEEV